MAALSDTIEGAIARPDAAQHFMVLRPVKARVTVRRGDTILASSTRATRLMEVGKTLYDPMIYIPKDDLVATLERQDHSTHCPLKGDATYYSLGGADPVANIAWSYDDPMPFSAAIKGLIAFYPDKTVLEEHPLQDS